MKKHSQWYEKCPETLRRCLYKEREREGYMLTFIFICLMFGIFGKLIGLAFKMTWGITKVLFTLVFLPVILIALAIGGLVTIALPILIVVGIISLICGVARR